MWHCLLLDFRNYLKAIGIEADLFRILLLVHIVCVTATHFCSIQAERGDRQTLVNEHHSAPVKSSTETTGAAEIAQSIVFTL